MYHCGWLVTQIICSCHFSITRERGGGEEEPRDIRQISSSNFVCLRYQLHMICVSNSPQILCRLYEYNNITIFWLNKIIVVLTSIH